MDRHPTAPAIAIRCYCAAVTLRADAAPASVVHCHCGQCRRLSGAAFTTWASFRKTSLRFTGAEPLSSFPVTPHVTRHFCRVCGSHVFTADLRLPNTFGVPAGAIAGDVPLQPSAHYFVDHRAAWQPLCDGLPQFGGESGVVPAGVAPICRTDTDP